jgi:hypothetical protein
METAERKTAANVPEQEDQRIVIVEIIAGMKDLIR